MSGDPASAQAFAAEWIAAWNARDLDRVLAHYADDAVMFSPVAARITGQGEVRGKAALAAYWQSALARVPDLHFTLIECLPGWQAVTLIYRNQNDQKVAETCRFDAAGRVCSAIACYAA